MKKLIIISIFFFLLTGTSWATSYPERTIEELASMSDLIAIGLVTKVDMVDHKGNQILDPKAMPGLKRYEFDNVLQFHVKIEDVLFYNSKKKFERNITIKLRGRRFPLGYAKEDFSGKSGLFFINSGTEYTHVSGRYIFNPVTDKEQTETYLFCKKFNCLVN